MSELGQTDDPKALVPGNAEAIFENVRVLRGRYDDVIAAGEALKRIEFGGGWIGQAADSFHQQHQNVDVPRWFSAGDSLNNGASALEVYAKLLVWAQGHAAGAIDLWQQGETATRQAKEAHAQAQTQAQPPPFVDAGEPQRQAAREMLNAARQQLAQVGDTTADALQVEAQLAPQDSRKQGEQQFYDTVGDVVEVGSTVVPGVGKAIGPVGRAIKRLLGSRRRAHPDDALYQSYLKRKDGEGKTPLSREAWQKKLDTLRQNKIGGDVHRDEVAKDLGIAKGKGGWEFERGPEDLKNLGRRWDMTNQDAGEAIEVKSGSTPVGEGLDQLAKDEIAVQEGWSVTWKLRRDLDPALMARLQELAKKYPGKFNYTVAGR